MDDNNCFFYSVLAGVKLPENNKHRVSYYRQRFLDREIEIGDLKYPIGKREIEKFEEMNPDLSVSSSAFNNDKESLIPLHTSKYYMRKHNIDLLSLTEGDKHHYTL